MHRAGGFWCAHWGEAEKPLAGQRFLGKGQSSAGEPFLWHPGAVRFPGHAVLSESAPDSGENRGKLLGLYSCWVAGSVVEPCGKVFCLVLRVL